MEPGGRPRVAAGFLGTATDAGLMAVLPGVATAGAPPVPGVAIVAVAVVGGVAAGEFAVDVLSAMLLFCFPCVSRSCVFLMLLCVLVMCCLLCSLGEAELYSA